MSDFEKIFVSALAKRLAKYGLNKKNKNSIFRKSKLGRCGVKLGFQKKLYGYDIRAYIFVRLDEVEELVGKFPPNPFWKEIATLSSEFGTYIDGNTRTWSAKFDDGRQLGDIFLSVLDDIGLPKSNVKSDSEYLIDEMVQSIEIFAVPFWDKYCDSPQNLLFIVAKDHREAETLCPSIGARAKTALAAAFLLGNKFVFDDVARQKENVLKKYAPSDLETFEQLKAYLQKKMEISDLEENQ